MGYAGCVALSATRIHGKAVAHCDRRFAVAILDERTVAAAGMLMRLAEREASFEHSVGLSELSAPEALALQERPPQLPLRITSRNRVEFQHDLAAEWARFQRLKEISDHTTRWAAFAQNPLWTGALRMLGQFLLRERVNDRTAWDIAFERLDAAQQSAGLATDILLDALCLDPLAESFSRNARIFCLPTMALCLIGCSCAFITSRPCRAASFRYRSRIPR